MDEQDKIRDILNTMSPKDRSMLAESIGRTPRQLNNIRAGKSGMQASTYLRLVDALKLRRRKER